MPASVQKYIITSALFMLLSLHASGQLFFRSAGTGNWTVASTWESAPAAGGPWSPAAAAPLNTDNTINLRAPHTVTITASMTLDEVVVEPGATLIFSGAISITIDDGTGPDLSINGTLEENSTNSLTWLPGATWIMGAGGTLVKTTGTSSNAWRDNYWGGIANIPATGNWILRKTGGFNPALSSVGGATYPNLVIENYSGSPWIMNIGSVFTGSSNYPRIKGDFDIGGSGPDAVSFLNQNTNATCVRVDGHMTIRAGHTYRNYGTGIELYGNLIVNGTVVYDGNDARRFIFSGSAPQSVTGSGSLGMFNMVMNKSSDDLALNMPVRVDNDLTFYSPGGRIFSSGANVMVISDDATVTGTKNSGFVHGPVRKLGDEAFTFPVGSGYNYQPITMGAGSAGSAPFWTEDFGSGCNTGLQASSFSGVNGSWSVTATGANEVMANIFYVSAAENGQAAGACGAGCGSDRTLHMGAHPSIGGDLGAAYFESDPFSCSFLGWCSATDKRAESPLIDCSGQSGITLAFDYIEYGEGNADNASLWYYDGTLWALLTDLPKTLCCGGITCDGFTQALWTAYSITLPGSADNNPNVRIGFRWTNNANGVGTDPSFAVDDITLSAPAGTDSFLAEYHYTDPVGTYGNTLDATLDHISRCEYWMLERESGTSSRTVRLSWDNYSCGVTNLSELRVARWRSAGTIWNDLGNGGTTGSTFTGTILSAAPVSLFGPFTLSSITTNNPLPVALLEFSARAEGGIVLLDWKTASEINNDYFTVERSSHGLHFDEILVVDGAGNSTRPLSYTATDEQPLSGYSYYRLKQTDFNGTFTHGPVRKVFVRERKGSVIANHATGLIIYHAPYPLTAGEVILVTDIAGRTVLRHFAGKGSLQSIPAGRLARGIYRLWHESASPANGFVY